jgi:hypothetical protein
LRLNAGRFRDCYGDALRLRPRLNGRVELRFVIGRDGSVSSSTVKKLERAPALADCLAGAMYAIGFPEPTDGIVTVLYPIVLEPPDSAPTPTPKHGHR